MQNLIDKFDALPLWQRLMYAGIVILVAILINPLSKALAGLLFIVAVCGALYRLVFRTGKARAWVNVGAGALILLIILDFFQPVRVSTTSSPAQAPAPAPASEPETIPVKIRVSGAPGTEYTCENSSFAFEEGESDPVRYEEDVRGTLSTGPVLYDSQAINKYPWYYDFVAATCNITGRSAPGGPPAGSLKAEILVDGEVKASEETRPDPAGKRSMKSEYAQPRWAPKCPNWDVDWDCG